MRQARELNRDGLIFLCPRRVPLANFACRIGGSVVRNDQLKISVILDQDGFKRLTNEPLTVVNRHADANQRSPGTPIALI